VSRRTTVALPLAGMALVLGLAFLLNPSPDRHRARIKQAVAQRNQVAGALGVGSIVAFASTYHSVGVASYTSAGGRTLSIGAFGVVFIPQ
jgi:hypothetical protein